LSYAIAGYAMNLAALYYGPEFDWVDACSVSVFRDLDSPAMHTMLRSLRDAMRANSIISDGSGGRLTVPPLSLEPAPEVFKDLQRIFTQHTNAEVRRYGNAEVRRYGNAEVREYGFL
jgi:hypothetical protein